jgi:hypothetical protein
MVGAEPAVTEGVTTAVGEDALLAGARGGSCAGAGVHCVANNSITKSVAIVRTHASDENPNLAEWFIFTNPTCAMHLQARRTWLAPF